METHYDTLNVTRTAPLEVIKASYRVLSQKYHPDRNADPSALQEMMRINAAWDVLSDAERRATHDRWIASEEARHAPPPVSGTHAQARSGHAPLSEPGNWRPRHTMMLAASAIAALLLFYSISSLIKAARIDAAQTELTQEPVEQTARQPWRERPWEAVPTQRLPHGYLAKEVQMMSEGRSMVEIDNVNSSQDAEVRLYRNGRVARSMFVHAGRHFLVENLAPGNYVLKYKIHSDGKMHAYQAIGELDLQQDADRPNASKNARVALADLVSARREIGLDQM